MGMGHYHGIGANVASPTDPGLRAKAVGKLVRAAQHGDGRQAGAAPAGCSRSPPACAAMASLAARKAPE